MEYINHTEFKLKNSAVSLGKFDGLHQGHRKLFDYILDEKKRAEAVLYFPFCFHREAC